MKSVRESIETVLEGVDSGDPKKVVSTWIAEIEAYEQEFKKWNESNRKIRKRYKNERGANTDERRGGAVKLNMLWSNVQTMQPAIYARTPKPYVERIFKDKDPLGREASQTIERSLISALRQNSFDDVMKLCRDDYLLLARGTSWVRYVPYFETVDPSDPSQMTDGESRNLQLSSEPMLNDGATGSVPEKEVDPNELSQFEGQVSEPLYSNPDGSSAPLDPKTIEADSQSGFSAPYEQIAFEEVKVDYINADDFLHNIARTWDEVWWVARKCYLTKDEVEQRFGKDCAEEVTYDQTPGKSKKDYSDKMSLGQSLSKKAIVYEVWDKANREAVWINKNYSDKPLDKQADPLELPDFFPCPKPLYGTLTSDTLVPRSDFEQYRDLSDQLDDIVNRRSKLITMVKVAGVYDASNKELARIMNEGIENQLIPVKDWPSLSGKGGLKGVLDWVPLDMVLQAIEGLNSAEEVLKGEIYEIIGIADIQRGNSNPDETAKAQQIKGQFASLRLSDRQDDMQRFARDTIAIMGDIIRKHFQPETIRILAGVDLLSPDMAQNFDRVIELLRNDEMCTFRVDIETDSTIAIDAGIEKQARTEMLQAVSTFLQQSVLISQNMPDFVPVLGEMLMFTVQAFKSGRNLEASIETAIEQQQARIKQAQQNPQPPPPDPKMIEAQAKQQEVQSNIQIAQMKLQHDTNLSQLKHGGDQEVAKNKMILEQQKAQHAMFLEEQKLQKSHEIELQKFQGDITLQAQKMQGELAIKAKSAEIERENQTVKEVTQSNPVPQHNINLDIKLNNAAHKKIHSSVDAKGNKTYDVHDVSQSEPYNLVPPLVQG